MFRLVASMFPMIDALIALVAVDLSSLRKKILCFAFSIQLKNRGWSRLAPKLLITLRDVYESSSRPGRSKLSSESKAAMDFFLVHGMVLLLQSTFQEGMKVPKGTRTEDIISAIPSL